MGRVLVTGMSRIDPKNVQSINKTTPISPVVLSGLVWMEKEREGKLYSLAQSTISAFCSSRGQLSLSSASSIEEGIYESHHMLIRSFVSPFSVLRTYLTLRGIYQFTKIGKMQYASTGTLHGSGP